MIVDFHSHTFASDGTLSPKELLAFMEERGVETFSVTDHDSLDAYAELFEIVPRRRLVVGIEINTTYRGNEVHVLGYGVPLEPSPLVDMLENNRRARERRIGRIVDGLAAGGVALSLEEIRAESAGNAALGRPHVAKALVRKGAAADVGQAFDLYLREGRPGYVPSLHVTPQLAVETIHAVGGVAVLAHPGRLKDIEVIDELIAAGLDGLEVIYPRHDAEQRRRYAGIAREHGLLMTAGSDFHDIRWNTGGVGMEVDRREVAPFLERVLV